MGPLFSLRPRAPLPALPPGGGAWKGGRGADPGPTSLPCLPPCGEGVGFRGLVDAADTPLFALRGCLLGWPSPRWGGPFSRRVARPSWGVRARVARLSVVLLGRSRSSVRCPRPSRCCRFPFLTGARCRDAAVVACPGWLVSRDGDGESF
ncbi:hypothetical protein HJG60_009543 [Phyllostomus discolor]|uniref:Uncharacterized protein n=1 Tax=Phyllostomus discolor TaxID=89673 RepID=A0A833YC24_9CHIR|nr:hypothetical protein HJG60_009543 [Phyllostomus discolor]